MKKTTCHDCNRKIQGHEICTSVRDRKDRCCACAEAFERARYIEKRWYLGREGKGNEKTPLL